MKKILLITIIIWNILVGTANGQYIHYEPRQYTVNNCVPTAISHHFNLEYARVPAMLSDTAREYNLKSWKSLHTVRYFTLDKFNYQFIYLKKGVTIKQLADTKLSMLAITLDNKVGHIVSIKDGNYYDREDVGNLEAKYILININNLKSFMTTGWVDGAWYDEVPQKKEHNLFFKGVQDILMYMIDFYIDKAINK